MLQILTFLAIAAAGYLAFRSRREMGYALGLMWSMYAFEQLVQQGNAFLLQRGSLINVGMTMLALGSLFFAVQRGELNRFSFQAPQICVICLMGLAVCSVVWTVSPNDTDAQLMKAAPYIFAFVIVSPMLAQNTHSIHKAIEVTIYFGGLILLGLLFSNLGQRGVVLTQSGGKAVEGNPLATASYAGTVAICAGLSLYSEQTNRLKSVLKFLIVVLGVWIILRSGSRGQMVALVVSTLLMLPLVAKLAFRRSTILPLMIIGMFCGAAILAVDHFSLGHRWRWVSIDGARQGRLAMVERLLDTWANGDPLTWVLGLGSSSSFKVVGFYPHCVPPEVLGELGLIGFGLLVIFYWSVTNRGLHFLRSQAIDPTTRIAIGTLFTLFFFDALLSLKQGSLLGSTSFLCHGISIGIATSTVYLMPVVNRRVRLHQPGDSSDPSVSGAPTGGNLTR